MSYARFYDLLFIPSRVNCRIYSRAARGTLARTRVNFLHILHKVLVYRVANSTSWYAIGGLYQAIRRTYDSLAARRTRRSEGG